MIAILAILVPWWRVGFRCEIGCSAFEFWRDVMLPQSARASDGVFEPSAPSLADDPDWIYLLREFETLYRHGSAGGSKAIRSHRKKVRDALSTVITKAPAVRPRESSQKPVTAHLNRALDLGERGPMHSMARALRWIVNRLTWEYGYERVPASLARKYAYCEVVGPRGPIESEALILGFVLFAPNTTYPQHSHQGIEESYISISGAWSENNAAVYAPGSLILNRAGDEHRITTGQSDPSLLAYAWIGSPENLAAPGMKLTSPRKASSVVR